MVIGREVQAVGKHGFPKRHDHVGEIVDQQHEQSNLNRIQ
mgnify:CR=1 FL=1